MLAWLRADLASVDRAKTPWVVAVAHYPVFCSGCLTGTPAGMPSALQPLFLRHGVDLFAAGHWHYYESLWPTVAPQPFGLPNTSMTPPMPVQRNFENPRAPVYVTAGGGGPPGPDGGAARAIVLWGRGLRRAAPSERASSRGDERARCPREEALPADYAETHVRGRRHEWTARFTFIILRSCSAVP